MVISAAAALAIGIYRLLTGLGKADASTGVLVSHKNTCVFRIVRVLVSYVWSARIFFRLLKSRPVWNDLVVPFAHF